jgi:hypothetical protein
MNLKSVIEFHRQKVNIDLLLLEKDGVERYLNVVKYSEERVEALGYSKALLYMNKDMFDMIFEKNVIETFKLQTV